MKKIAKTIMFLSLALALITGITLVAYKVLKGKEEAAYIPEAEPIVVEEVKEEIKEEPKEEVKEIETKEEPEEEIIEPDPLTHDEISLHNIYAQIGEEVILSVYREDAISYDWEIYDPELKDFIKAPAPYEESDELFRKVSHIKVETNDKNMMVRCKVKTQSEEIEENAYIFPVDNIISISVDDKVELDGGGYIDTSRIPVNITYEDGRCDTVCGLNGLYFFDHMEESTEVIKDETGKRKIIKTVEITQSEYMYLGIEEKAVTLMHGDESFETTLCGTDKAKPEIVELKTDYQEDYVSVKIEASDNITPLPELTYALIKKGSKVKDKDFNYQDEFKVIKTDYGDYEAFVKDSSGNINSVELRLEKQDNTPPEIINISVVEKGEDYEG